MVFGAAGSRDAAALRFSGHAIELKSPSPLPLPTVNGSTLNHREVEPGVDIREEALTSGFDLQIVLTKRPTRPFTISLPVTDDGLQANTAKGGRLEFRANHKVLAAADPSVIYDSTVGKDGEPANVSPVGVNLAGGKLVITPAVKFLEDPSVSYPVTIDPAPNLAPVIDTFVSQSSPTTTFAGSTLLKAGKSASEGPDRTLLSFNINQFVGADVLSAGLNLFESFAGSCTASGLQVWDLSSSWTSSVNWNTQPAKNQMLQVARPMPAEEPAARRPTSHCRAAAVVVTPLRGLSKPGPAAQRRTTA